MDHTKTCRILRLLLIFTISIFGTNLHSLGDCKKALQLYPAWSPDEHYIAFESNKNGNGDIYLYDVRNSGVRNITQNNQLDDGNFSWSPDGRFITYISETSPENYDVMIMDIVDNTYYSITNKMIADNRSPRWSPNNEYILFINGHLDNLDLWLYDLKTQVYLNLTSDLPIMRLGSPTWSRDSKYIVFNGDPLAPESNLWMIDVASLSISQLTFNELDSHPSFSANGENIAFISYRSGNLDVWVLNLATKSLINVTKDNPFTDMEPRWSPVEEKIAYTATGTPNADIRIINLRQPTPHTHVENYLEGENPDWSIDGKKIVFESVSLYDGFNIYDFDTDVVTEIKPFETHCVE